MPSAVFRCDASPQMGGGHVMRCLALADVLSGAGWHIAFAVQPETVATARILAAKGYELFELPLCSREATAAMQRHWPIGCDLLIVDHYGLGRAFERACRSFARRIMAIDDLADREHDCDLLLDQTLGVSRADYDDLVPDSAITLMGPSYAMVALPYGRIRELALMRRAASTQASRAVISFGLTDPGNLCTYAIESIAQSDLDIEADVFLGASAPYIEQVGALLARLGGRFQLHVDVTDMSSHLVSADFAIGAAGGSAWERCTVGLPTVAMLAADNQRLILARLIAAGAAIGCQNEADVEASCIAAIRAMALDHDLWREMSRNAALVCDGRGLQRILATLMPRLANDGRAIRLRPATADDADIMLEWQRHPATRQYALTQAVPSESEHRRWLAGKLKDPGCIFNIILHDEQSSGILRFDLEESDPASPPKYRVSIFIAPDHYRRGIATEALRLGAALIPHATLIAEVLAGNSASHALFARASFAHVGGLYCLPPREESLSNV